MGLAQDFANLGEELIASFDARVGFLGENIVNTDKYLKQCGRDHKAMARKQRAALAAFVDDLEKAVHKLQQRFRQEHAKMSDELDEELDAFMEHLEKTVAAMQRRFQKENHARAREHKANAQAWKRVSETMAAKKRAFNQQLNKAKQSTKRKAA